MIDFESSAAGAFTQSIGLERNQPGAAPLTIFWRGDSVAPVYATEHIPPIAGFPTGFFRRNQIDWDYRLRFGSVIGTGNVPGIPLMANGIYRFHFRVSGIIDLIPSWQHLTLVAADVSANPFGQMVRLGGPVITFGDEVYERSITYPSETGIGTLDDAPLTDAIALNMANDDGPPNNLGAHFIDRIVSFSAQGTSFTFPVTIRFNGWSASGPFQSGAYSGGESGDFDGTGDVAAKLGDALSPGATFRSLFYANDALRNPPSLAGSAPMIPQSIIDSAPDGLLSNCNALQVQFLGAIPQPAATHFAIRELTDPVRVTDT